MRLHPFHCTCVPIFVCCVTVSFGRSGDECTYVRCVYVHMFSVYIYVCMYVRMYVRRYIRMYVRMYVQKCRTYVYVCIQCIRLVCTLLLIPTPLPGSSLDIVKEEERLWSLNFYKELCVMESLARNGSVRQQTAHHSMWHTCAIHTTHTYCMDVRMYGHTDVHCDVLYVHVHMYVFL